VFDIKSVKIWLNTGKWLMLKAFLLCQFWNR
jgi:hypothetical protein